MIVDDYDLLDFTEGGRFWGHRIARFCGQFETYRARDCPPNGV